MFSLIITVISIALVAALAVASVYYGGPALSKGTSRAAAATVVSQGQQISGAATLYASDNAQSITAFSDLTSNNYLTTLPSLPAAVNKATTPTVSDWTLGTSGVYAYSLSSSADICLEVEKNRDSNVSTIPATSAGGQFGCFGTAGTVAPIDGDFNSVAGNTGEDFTIYYKL